LRARVDIENGANLVSILDAIPRTYEDLGRANAQRQLGGVVYGHALADIGQSIATLPAQYQQRRSMALREQEMNLAVRKQQREEAADLALQQATSAALNPDGTINTNLLTTHLAGTPAASRIPTMVEGLTRMQEMGKQLQISSGKAGESEDDVLGAAAHAAGLAHDPADQAGVFLASVAAAQKNGSVTPERAKREVASLMGDDGNPDPTKVPDVLSRLSKGSKEQRTLAEGEERTASLKGERDERSFQVQLGRYANQLASAPDQGSYARRYAGIDPKFQPYFDAPETWTPQSAERAAQATMRPQDRIAEQRAATAALSQQARESRLDKAEADRIDIEKQRVGLEGQRVGIERDRERRLAGAGATDDKTARQAYAQYVAAYQKARTEERQRAPKVFMDDGTQRPDVGTYQPPPAFEKWGVMTPQERQAVLTKPDLRIDDAEMLRRQGGGSASPPPPTSTAPAAPAAPASAAPAPAAIQAAAASKVVTLAELQKIAAKRGTTVDQERERYITGGYAVVK
jgi:hypothetical protein